MEPISPFRGFVEVPFNFFHPIFKVHIAHVLFDDFLDKLAGLSRTDLRGLLREGFGAVVSALNFEIHDFFFQLSDLFLMEFDFVGNLTYQMGIEPFKNVRYVFHFFETALLTVEFFYFVLQTDDLLIDFFFLSQVRLPELDKFTIFSGQLISFVFELWQFLVNFMFLHLKYFSREGSLDLLLKLVHFLFGVFVLKL